MRKTDPKRPGGGPPSKLMVAAIAITTAWLSWLFAVIVLADATALWLYIVLLAIAWLIASALIA